MNCRPSLSRWSTHDLVQHVQQSGLVASLSGSTLWRGLHQDAIRPWYHHSWVFPRDPEFAGKAGRVLEKDSRFWKSRLAARASTCRSPNIGARSYSDAMGTNSEGVRFLRMFDDLGPHQKACDTDDDCVCAEEGKTRSRRLRGYAR